MGGMLGCRCDVREDEIFPFCIAICICISPLNSEAPSLLSPLREAFY